jgi:hypothetical protein
MDGRMRERKAREGWKRKSESERKTKTTRRKLKKIKEFM